MSNLIPLKTPRRACACCGFRFVPMNPSHTLCRTCYAYGKAGSHLQMAARLLRGMR